jgi:hypothetical protein
VIHLASSATTDDMTKLAHQRERGAVLALLSFSLIFGCAGNRDAAKVTIDRGFPTKAQLTQWANAPVPARGRAPQVGLPVDEWELTGPFPEQPGSSPVAGATPLARALGERLGAHGKGIVVTQSMQCYAREAGLFVARHAQLPADDLQAFMAGRCGALPIAPTFVYSKVNEGLSDDAAVKLIEDATVNAPASCELGVWLGGSADRQVILAAYGVPKVKLTSIEPSLERASAVRVRGALTEPAAWVRGYATERALGVRACEPTPGAALLLPNFDLTCTVDVEEPYAVVDIFASAPEAMLGRQAVTLLLSTGRGLPSTFRALALSGVPGDAGFLQQLNHLRIRLGRSALEDVPAQSEAARTLLPRYFFAAANKDAATVDGVTLGMMAGWDVPGTLRESQFLSFRGTIVDGAPSLLSQMLFFPSNRGVLLDPKAKQVALATMHDGKNKTTSGVLVTYTAFEPREYPEVEKELLDELDRQRQARGKGPVLRAELPQAKSLFDNVMEKLGQGDVAPKEGLEQTLRILSRRLQRHFSGRVSYAMATDGWRPSYDGELVDADEIAVMVKVGFYAPPGDHFGQYVSYIVFGPRFEAESGLTVPSGMLIR